MGCQEKKINAIVVVWLDCSRWMDDGMSEKTMDGWMHGWMEERILMVLKVSKNIVTSGGRRFTTFIS